MKKEDVMKRVEFYRNSQKEDMTGVWNRLAKIEERIDKMLEKTVIEPQERKLIMSVDELVDEEIAMKHYRWAKSNTKEIQTFIELKYIENQWNDGKEFDWKDEEKINYKVFLIHKTWNETYFWNKHMGTNGIFNFQTREHAQLFLETFAKELEIIKPLFS